MIRESFGRVRGTAGFTGKASDVMISADKERKIRCVFY